MTPVHKIWLLDVLDILLVAALFYRLLVGVKGTRSAQMFVGLLVLVVLSAAARFLNLITVDYIATNLRTVWLITFVILFQPELRHALAQFGRTRYFRSFLRVDEYGVLGEVVRAAEHMSENRHGGLIVLERNEGLRNFVETGTRLDARVRSELIETLFTPNSPLHDGAVIIRGDQIVAAGCILPLSQNPRISPALGTRHRAAIGISEETDAVAVCISEHTRAISVAWRGVLLERLDEGKLRSELSRILRISDEEEEEAAQSPPASSGPGSGPVGSVGPVGAVGSVRKAGTTGSESA
ncbi:MAG: diadenylate cyclase CdaA [Candidatus Eiseniibacteriota bacterium]